MIIAIDGPSGSGKGTLSKMIAKYYDFDYLDTGSLYRAAALEVLESNIDPSNVHLVTALATKITAKKFSHPELKSETTAKIASIISKYTEVRKALLGFQINFANSPPNGQGAVIEGRDIGTIVCPEADVKFFIDAKIEIRAKRRYKELKNKEKTISYEDIQQKMVLRDERDKNRVESPLIKAPEAHFIDTSDLDIEDVFLLARSIIDQTSIAI